MSAYTEIKVEFRDLEALIAALCEVGTNEHQKLTRDQIEVHPNGAHLVGYHGDTREQKANVIVRRKLVGSASNDIGFERLPSGAYVARISEFDSRHGYGSEWLGRVSQKAAVASVMAKAKARGYAVKQSVQADGSIRMVLAR